MTVPTNLVAWSMRRLLSASLLALALCDATLVVAADEVGHPAPPTPIAPGIGNESETAKESTLLVQVRAGQHDDFDRVVFDWPKNVSYKVVVRGGEGKIIFDAPATIRLDQRTLPKFKRLTNFAVVREGTKTAVTFLISSGIKISDFTNGLSIALDAKGEVPVASPQPVPAKPVAEKVKPAEAPSPRASKIMPVAKQTMHEAMGAGMSVAPASTPTPPPSEEPKEAAATAPKPLAQLAQPVMAPAAEPEEKHSEAPVSQEAEVEPTAPQSTLAPVQERSERPAKASNNEHQETVPTTVVPAAPPYSAALDQSLGQEPKLVLSLDPKLTLRTAVYVRARYAYVIFEKKVTLPLEQILVPNTVPLVKLEPLNIPNGSGYRFPIGEQDRVDGKRDGTVWQIYLSRSKEVLPISTVLVAQPNFALGARYVLPLPDTPEVVKLTDPVVGDDLYVLPLAQNMGFGVSRRMAEFELLPASIGMVIRPLTDKVIVRSVSDGVEVTSEGGLRLSPAVETGSDLQADRKIKDQSGVKSLFDFATWRGKSNETFNRTRQRLQQTIVDVPEIDRNRARLELARFYFAWGHGAEAVGLLRYLAAQVPDLMAHADFLALLGASEVLANHPDEALKLLENPVVQNVPEAMLWQAVAYADQRRWQDAVEHFTSSEVLLQGYPEPFYSRFMVLAIESALALKRNTMAADWLDRLDNNSKNERSQPAREYLRGVLHAEAGRGDAASDEWKEAAKGRDRLYKIRAELALIDLGVATKSTTVMQAIDRLEALRFAWRGDDLEVDILHRLGQFYIQAKNVKAGMGTFTHAMQLYPDSPLVPTINDEMAAAFHDVFLGELGKDMSPLDALSVYQKYRAYTPKGTDGDLVMRDLAERLVAVDLLDQASMLLTELMEQRLQGEPKVAVATRLAAISLLNHDYDKALSILDNSNSEAAAFPAMAAERTVLRAKALSSLKKDEEALNLIKGMDTRAARLLRADITMHGQMWDDAAKALLDLLGTPPRAGQQLKPEQVDWVLSAAVAMSNASNVAGLDKLSIDFGAAMSGTPAADAFQLLTKPDMVTEIKDISAAQSKISGVDMFQSFLNTYRNVPAVEKSMGKDTGATPVPAKAQDKADDAAKDKKSSEAASETH